MGSNFYSGTDAELASGSSNLVTIVTPVPATYGLTIGQVTSYGTLATNFGDLLALTDAPATRTTVTVQSKNIAKHLLKTESANLARIFIATPSVTNPMLAALRMNERVIPQPRPLPALPPVLEVKSVSGRIATIVVHDATTERRGVPFGAVSANIYSYVGPTPPTSPRDYHYEGTTTRGKTQVNFPDTVANGATVWLAASWVGTRGQIGVACTPVPFTLQGGPVLASAA